MHAAAFHVLRTVQRPFSSHACRVIGSRHRLSRRNFHHSAISHGISEGPTVAESDRQSIASEHQESRLEDTKAHDEDENPTFEAKIQSITSSNPEHGLDLDEAAIIERENGNYPVAEIEQEITSPQAPDHGVDEPKREQDIADGSNAPVDVENWALGQRRHAKSGPGRLRANRSRQPEGLPPVILPGWFWNRNVKCVGDPDLSGSLAVYGEGGVDIGNSNDEKPCKDDILRQIIDLSECDLTSTQNAKYSVHVDVYKEILSSIRAGLTLRPPRNFGSSSIPRPLTLLQCPKDGGTYYLDSIVETIAGKLGADLVRLDAEDIAQIVGTYVDENLAWTWSKTALLGYDAQKVAGKLEEYDKYSNSAEEDLDVPEDEDDISNILKGNKSSFSASNPSGLSKKLASLFNSSMSSSGQPRTSPFSDSVPMIELFSVRGGDSNPNPQMPLKPGSDQWNDLKVATVLEALIGAADLKRTPTSVESDRSECPGTEIVARDVIIQVRDFKELNGTSHGAELLRRLRNAINKRWYEGRNIILIGTTSTEEAERTLSRPDIQHLQSDIIDGEKRTILVPPDRREEQGVAFESDEKDRIRNINTRHIEDMITKLADGNQDSRLIVDIEKDLDNAIAYSAGLEDAVWTYAHVHRLATTVLGLRTSANTIDGSAFTKAWKLLTASDEAKFRWGAAELKEEDDDVNFMLQDLSDSPSSKRITKDKIMHIRKNCTTHEKRLLGGVIIPSDIHTTFADVRAPKETVEALKTLTSLSLIRPEAFSYGVLATDRIPGLLLYGPPGTGKTLLAKAVAKESGATVLEVSGADVNDMYVGEGEKNVKAIFTLAKKLSPCIVFIDEADAIFAARGESKRTGTHRELINQFLREWDGMNDLSAFIMVATNRPFDLDEAVLRRLPRRLLVDLPVEKDREAILKIHLKDEILHESVSLPSLAKNTLFYSGSDLKNLSVAAALACIREENEAAAQHTGEEPYLYPEKRILMKFHFDKAMEEISASISEDMSTLAAIRKFDEKYGDRKGRRKKGSALGFGGTSIQEKDSEAARVRKIDVQ